jgi:hypothetical protein
MKLRLADDLVLPAEAATQTFLVVGKRGSGKSTTCVRLAEQLIKADVPIIALDPVDRWWGLKASRDGKGPGLSVYIFGGEHADLPLERGAGVVIADSIVDHRISAVLSIKHLSGRERGQFVADLAGRLFQRNKEPLHVFLEEAHEVAPQQPFKGEEEMLGRVTRLWKLGRSSGLGGSAITQRPASLSKNITTQAEILIVHRTLGPQDVAAVREWIRYHGEREEILGELATLKTGEAFIWAPDFPEGKPIGLRRVSILDRETFDSTATPKVGARAVEPKSLAPVDLEQLKTKMAATIERAKAEDPRELRRRIQELEAELRKKSLRGTQQDVAPKRVEIPVLKKDLVERLQANVARIERAAEVARDELTKRSALWRDLMTVAKEVAAALQRVGTVGTPATSPRADLVRARQRGATAAEILARPTAIMVSRTADSDGVLTGPERKILTALAQHGERSVTALALLTGYAARGGAFRNPLSALRSKGYADGREIVRITDVGRDVLGTWEPLPTGEALLRYWLDHLPGPEAKLLGAVAGAYPKTINVEDVAAATGYEVTGGAFRNPLSRLRTLRLVSGRADVRASAELF